MTVPPHRPGSTLLSHAPALFVTKPVKTAMHLFWRMTRGMTLGVRGVVLNDRDEVFLVRHSYVAGWHFPGGGIEVGDTALQALAKELEEEANISPTDEPRLHGLFLNRDAPRDHIAVYIVRQFRQSGPRLADAEIVEAAFFPLAALPEHTTRSTRDRLAEIINGGGVSAFW